MFDQTLKNFMHFVLRSDHGLETHDRGVKVFDSLMMSSVKIISSLMENNRFVSQIKNLAGFLLNDLYVNSLEECQTHDINDNSRTSHF